MRCRNCDTPLDGQFCTSCGQREGRGDLHFGEAVTDILGDVFTWDSRVWRTLISLLFRPGFLSAEFNVGRRARYMPPFRLYIVVSFLLFLTLSLMATYVVDFGGSDEDSVGPSVTFGLDVDATSDDAEAAVSDAPPADVESALAKKIAEERAAGNVEVVEFLEEFEAGLDSESASGEVTVNLLDGGPEWVTELEKRIETNASQVSDDPGDYIGQLFEYLPQVMFIMLPLFALLLKLVYLTSPFHYLQHLVFALHYHTFVYLLYLLTVLLELASLRVDGLFSMMLIIYLVLALRRTYASGWPGAIGKTLFLLFSYGVSLMIGMAIAAVVVLAAM
ncbi:DUF3667 domain-containing protein [Congregibacter brevis]|uniref:DUF3667 domain-containing protein n=1 Tax=Congregibacter brevis TaxID=3081201 RepID=A0ABZ0IE08_9GAMM|nr:DUF3667 domain-containing protein [Congregibacter sp. IMCC45268]